MLAKIGSGKAEATWEAYLNHLLQYLQGRVLGFGSLALPLPSTFKGGLDACGDCTDIIIVS